MPKLLPVPSTPPSPQAARLIKSLEGIVTRPVTNHDGAIRRFTDLLHVEDAVRNLLDEVVTAAVDDEGVSFTAMAARTGLAKSAVQNRVNRGRAARKAAGHSEAAAG